MNISILQMGGYKIRFRLSNCLILLFSVVAFNLTSCQKFDDIDHRLDNLEISVSELQSAVLALQTAYNQGKIIK